MQAAAGLSLEQQSFLLGVVECVKGIERQLRQERAQLLRCLQVYVLHQVCYGARLTAYPCIWLSIQLCVSVSQCSTCLRAVCSG